MKKMINKIIALTLCMALFLSIGNAIIFAENETNTLGVTFSAVLDTDTLTISDEEQIVTLTVVMSQSVDYKSFEYQIVCDDAVKINSVTTTTGAPTLNGKNVAWMNSSLVSNSVLSTIQFTIPANASGVYELGVQGIAVQGSGIDYWEDGACALATLSIEEPDEPETPVIPTEDPYTADLQTSYENVKVGDEITVDVLVGGTTGEFASSELELTYTGLTFDADNSTANGADITAENGTIKIIDHGETTTWTEGTVTAYTLKFTVDAITGEEGTATVTLDSAALSTAANAKENDLTPATITVAEKTFAVAPADLTVTLPAGITGNTTVEYDGTITIEATDKNYEYELLVSGNYTIIDNGDGTWTIKNVTEDIAISINKKQGKEHTITFSDLAHIKDQENATIAVRYGNDFSFTLKDTEYPTVGQDGIQYILDSIKYTGSDVDVTRTNNGTTYTIPGSAITGDITITTSAAPLSAEVFTVKVTEDSTDLSAPTTANKGQTITLTLTPEAGYKYTVTYTMGNNAAVTIENWVDQDGGKATAEIANVNGNIKITVDKEVDKGEINVEVKEYLDLDDETMYLITAAGALADDKVYTYDGNDMFYSEEYSAYVWLVITDANETLTEDTALTNISIAQGSATSIDYTGDVNNTEKVDANDAQLVWNIYNDKLYSNFNALSMEKFLRADVDGDGAVGMNDASEIVRIIKTQN